MDAPPHVAAHSAHVLLLCLEQTALLGGRRVRELGNKAAKLGAHVSKVLARFGARLLQLGLGLVCQCTDFPRATDWSRQRRKWGGSDDEREHEKAVS